MHDRPVRCHSTRRPLPAAFRRAERESRMSFLGVDRAYSGLWSKGDAGCHGSGVP
jgi:hypothetical protein